MGTKKILRTVLIILGILFLISTYLGCVFGSMFSEGPMVVNPLKMFGWIRANGFPTLLVMGIALFLAIAVISNIFNYIATEGKADEKGRPFRQPRRRKTYGDAHFEKPNEYKDAAVIKSPQDALGPILGQLDASGKHLIAARTKKLMGNYHMAVFGISGHGKSYTFTNNYILQAVRRRESLVISDPDGGLERDFRGYLVNKGYVVRTLNLKEFLFSNGWNCLRSVAHENPDVTVTKIQIFTRVCIENAFSGNKKDDIYFVGPLELLRALVMRVWFDDGRRFPPEEKNMKTVISLLNKPDIGEFLTNLFDESTMMTNDEKRCLGPWRTFLSSSANLKGNLITNLGSMLGVIQESDALATLLSTDDIDLELPGDQPCAYFCRFSDTDETYKFIVSLFFSMIVQMLVDKADASPGGKLRVPVDFLLDEFPSIGVLPDWKNKMAVLRKRNMNVIMVFQNITQLQSNYKDDWVTIISNCDVFLSLAVNDEFTASMLQKRIGTTTVRVRTESHSADETVLSSMVGAMWSSGEGKRDLLSLEEIMKMNQDESLVLLTGHDPILAKKYPYTNHPEAYLTGVPDPLGPMPLMSDVKARKTRQEREDALLSEYYTKHPSDMIHRDEVAPDDPATFYVVVKTQFRQLTNRLKQWLHRVHTGEDIEVEQPEHYEEAITLDDDWDGYIPSELDNSSWSVSSNEEMSDSDLDAIFGEVPVKQPAGKTWAASAAGDSDGGDPVFADDDDFDSPEEDFDQPAPPARKAPTSGYTNRPPTKGSQASRPGSQKSYPYC